MGSARTPSVLYVVNSLDFFCSHRLPIALAAQAEGYQIAVATPPSPRDREIEALGFQFLPLPMSRKGVNPLGEFATLLRLWWLLVRHKPSIAHFITIKPILYGGIAARFSGTSAYVSAVCGLGHVFTARGFAASVRRMLVRLGYRFAMGGRGHRAIFQNPDDMRYFVESGLLDPERATLIKGSGVDPSVYRAPPPYVDPPIVLFAARLLREKGVPEFIAAAKCIRQSNPEVRFVIAGAPDPGNPTSMTEQELVAATDSGTIEWWGPQSDMRSVFERATIVCLPSKYGEGVPKVLIEAASCGRAIVTTNVPGCREIVRHEENGVLVQPGSVDELADAILRLLEDSSRTRAMGAAGRQLVLEEFSVEKVVEETISLYRLVTQSD